MTPKMAGSEVKVTVVDSSRNKAKGKKRKKRKTVEREGNSVFDKSIRGESLFMGYYSVKKT